jgi:hypothetical protein
MKRIAFISIVFLMSCTFGMDTHSRPVLLKVQSACESPNSNCDLHVILKNTGDSISYFFPELQKAVLNKKLKLDVINSDNDTLSFISMASLDVGANDLIDTLAPNEELTAVLSPKELYTLPSFDFVKKVFKKNGTYLIRVRIIYRDVWDFIGRPHFVGEIASEWIEIRIKD